MIKWSEGAPKYFKLGGQALLKRKVSISNIIWILIIFKYKFELRFSAILTALVWNGLNRIETLEGLIWKALCRQRDEYLLTEPLYCCWKCSAESLCFNRTSCCFCRRRFSSSICSRRLRSALWLTVFSLYRFLRVSYSFFIPSSLFKAVS